MTSLTHPPLTETVCQHSDESSQPNFPEVRRKGLTTRFPRMVRDDSAVRHAPRSRAETLVLLDPSSLQHAFGYHDEYRARPLLELLDLERLRVELDQRFKNPQFTCILGATESGVPHVEKQFRSAGWDIERCRRKSVSRIGRTPETMVVAERILAARSFLDYSPMKNVVVVSHNEAIAGPIKALLKAGGQASVVGLIGMLPRHLYNLSVYFNCGLLDLEHDLHSMRQSRDPIAKRVGRKRSTEKGIKRLDHRRDDVMVPAELETWD